MTLYLDTSVLLPLFISDAFTARADALLRHNPPELLTSDLALAEFSSAVAAQVRAGSQSVSDARLIFAEFDAWIAKAVKVEYAHPTDFAAATASLRRLDLPLKAADAIHLAAVLRLGADLATFDRQMAISATGLGVRVVE